ncbi:hypothetical protein ACUN9Y_19080 [Halomonas sp. V046]|uniref:hypothetical protein n=1 Tax=Halomonas sp. V046 TaxID=3459611 RepID=UPI004043AAFD
MRYPALGDLVAAKGSWRVTEGGCPGRLPAGKVPVSSRLGATWPLIIKNLSAY